MAGMAGGVARGVIEATGALDEKAGGVRVRLGMVGLDRIVCLWSPLYVKWLAIEKCKLEK